MTRSLGVCLVCGEPLRYFEAAQEVTCEECGRVETAHAICQSGHYVCDQCHRARGVEHVLATCATSDLRDPIALAQQIMADDALYPNGPEHHTLAGAVLLTTYRNAGGALDLSAALVELRRRSLTVPGGVCGYWGTCGAAISAGMYCSIVLGATPMTPGPWGQTARLTSRILDHLADVGGPRCCKRSTFIALQEAAAYTAETMGVTMELPAQVTCTFMARNAECLRTACPFFPKRAHA